MARAAPQPVYPPLAQGEGTGAYIRRLLSAGTDGDTVLAAVRANFPNSRATMADISWNRGRLKKDAIAVAASAPVAKKRGRPAGIVA